MKNKYKFKEKIFEICCGGDLIAVERGTNVPSPCRETKCENCKFRNRECQSAFAEWCNEEYIEPCEFEKDELVEVSDDCQNWKIRHFAGMNSDRDYPYSAYNYGFTSVESTSETKYKYCKKYGTIGGLI